MLLSPSQPMPVISVVTRAGRAETAIVFLLTMDLIVGGFPASSSFLASSQYACLRGEGYGLEYRGFLPVVQCWMLSCYTSSKATCTGPLFLSLMEPENTF